MVGAELVERRAASWSTATSGPACPASMPPATWSSASTRSAMRWAKAESPRPRSATTCARKSRAGASRAARWRSRRRQLGEELRVEDDPAVLKIGNARLETGSASACRPRASISSRSPAPKFSTATTVPDRVAVRVHRRQADQVGVIIFALLERRQRRAVDLDQRAAQRLGGGAVADAFEARDRGLAAVADGKEAPLDASDVELLDGAQGSRRCR